MAILKSAPGLEVTVRVNNTALKEYEDADEAITGQNTAFKYIEVPGECNFDVACRVKGGTRFKKNCMVFYVYVDGSYADNFIIRAKDTRRSDRHSSTNGRPISKDQKALFKFSTLQMGQSRHEAVSRSSLTAVRLR
jgi:hypothetical protein